MAFDPHRLCAIRIFLIKEAATKFIGADFWDRNIFTRILLKLLAVWVTSFRIVAQNSAVMFRTKPPKQKQYSSWLRWHLGPNDRVNAITLLHRLYSHTPPDVSICSLQHHDVALCSEQETNSCSILDQHRDNVIAAHLQPIESFVLYYMEKLFGTGVHELVHNASFCCSHKKCVRTRKG